MKWKKKTDNADPVDEDDRVGVGNIVLAFLVFL